MGQRHSISQNGTTINTGWTREKSPKCGKKKQKRCETELDQKKIRPTFGMSLGFRGRGGVQARNKKKTTVPTKRTNGASKKQPNKNTGKEGKRRRKRKLESGGK